MSAVPAREHLDDAGTAERGRRYDRRPRHRQDIWADLSTAAHIWVLTRRDRNPWAWACAIGIAVAFLGPH